MNLLCSTLAAVLSLTMVTAAAAQSSAANPPDTRIKPFATLAFGPAPLQSRHFDNGGAHPGVEGRVGARKRLSDAFGVVVSGNAGTMFQTVIGGENAVCRIRQDGKSGCYPNSPVVNWFGVAAGGEAYLGNTIVSLQFGPASVGAPSYERQLVAGSPAREFGFRTQVDANFPVYRQLGITLSLSDQYVPEILNDRWHLTSFGFGISWRAFHNR